MRELQVRTRARRELVDITQQVTEAARESGGDGVWMVYVPHTTAGVTVNEGADPNVATDIVMALENGFRSATWTTPRATPARDVDAHRFVVWAMEPARCAGNVQSIFFCEFDGPVPAGCAPQLV